MRKSYLLAAVAAISLSALPAMAATIVYNVNQTIGSGSVTGTITTNGTIGILTKPDITAFNLHLTGSGGVTFDLDNSSAGVLVGNISDPFNPNAGNQDLTADGTNIYFNFDGTDGGYFGFQQVFYSGQHYWCNASQGQGFDCLVGKSVAPVNFFDPSFQNVSATGNQIIASTGVIGGGVPEPAAWGMMLLGFGVMGSAMRRRVAARICVLA